MRVRVVDVLVGVGRWLVWRPWRLVVLVIGVVVVGVVVHGVVVAGGGSDGVESSVSAGPSGWDVWPTAGATGGVVPEVTPAASGGPSVGSSSTVSGPVPSESPSGASVPPAVWNDLSRAMALDAGRRALTAYLAGDQATLDSLTYGDIKILASASDVSLSTPDPSLPGAPVAHLASENSPLMTVVVIPTSGGLYSVTVGRVDGGSPWLVQDIRAGAPS